MDDKTGVIPEQSLGPERRFRLWLYLLIVFVLSWPFQIISALGPPTLAWAVIFNSLSMIMVGVGTFLSAYVVFKDGLADAGWRWGSGKYWLVAIGIPAVLWIVPAIVDLALKNIHLPKTLTVSQMAWIGEVLFVVMIPAFAEEIGWRGYMLPHMTRVMSPRKAVIWHGAIWYAWHLPLVGAAAFAIMRAELPEYGTAIVAAATAGTLVASCVLVIFSSAIFAKLWAASGSIVIATILHGACDGFRDSLAITVGSGPFGGLFAPVMTMLIGAYLLWKTDASTFQCGHSCEREKVLQMGASEMA